MKDKITLEYFKLGADPAPEWFKNGEKEGKLIFKREGMIDADTLKEVPQAITEIYIVANNKKLNFDDYVAIDDNGNLYSYTEKEFFENFPIVKQKMESIMLKCLR